MKRTASKSKALASKKQAKTPVASASTMMALLKPSDLEQIPKYFQDALVTPTWTDNNVSKLESRIVDYLKHCADNQIPLTITELTLATGLANRQGLYELAGDTVGKPLCSQLVKKVLKIISMTHERGMHKQSNSGHIFALKNMFEPWTDRQDINVTAHATSIVVITGLPEPGQNKLSEPVTIDVEALSDNDKNRGIDT